MNGLTATGITVGICAGLWQMVSSRVGLTPGWELLGTIGFVAFCSFYAAGGSKAGFVKSLFVNYTGAVWAFLAALASGWLACASGLSSFWASVVMTVPFSAVIVWQGRFWLTSFIPGGFLGMTLFFATGLNWTVTLLGFLAGNCVGFISEYAGRKLSESTSKESA
ncbi:TPA: DUF1097 domain-containing protein [Citrobacter farmeri]|uniref:DUF1097 domain-containing protein n=1 Tax=Citrobacter farmeri TaxID=67824 RepID=UPI0021AD196D|nr:DUF1097 domain-containing protein [Citrobacter farmeri]HCC5836807.1 DUF1097 domain-containing protein [Citrobacter farmeri]HCD7553469.1 DUF1097 domain-containing protein [Citrobacter farmeri]HEM7924480.1 DUF1097 domain-containing protein [Citrobacter farmeri]